jgi:hypothetical protein
MFSICHLLLDEGIREVASVASPWKTVLIMEALSMAQLIAWRNSFFENHFRFLGWGLDVDVLKFSQYKARSDEGPRSSVTIPSNRSRYRKSSGLKR